jgi:hypothetical protein
MISSFNYFIIYINVVLWRNSKKDKEKGRDILRAGEAVGGEEKETF